MRHRLHIVALGLVLGAPLRAAPSPDPSPAPVHDAPFVGVYEAGLGMAKTDAFAAWINRKVVWGHDTIPFGPGSTWNHIAGVYDEWFYKPWSEWVHALPGRRFVISVPLLPGPVNGSGPTEGPGAGEPVSLADGAAGKYDAYFKGLGETLVKYGLGDAVVRLGWEWNGNWYAWKVVTPEDAKNFAAYWRHAVLAMRSVPGAEGVKVVWNVTAGFKTGYDANQAWPGDDVVDYVGLDVYDTCWPLYPPPGDATAAQIETLHQRAWAEFTAPEASYGLAYWQKLADAHAKPLAIPEWGVIRRADGHGGGDNPYFVQRVFDYIQDPAHHVYFASYFDADGGGEGNSRISNVTGAPSPFPQSSELFKKLLSEAP